MSRIFDDMYRLSVDEELGFPACVPKSCREFNEYNAAATWATPVHDGLAVRSVPYSFQTEVLQNCPRLIDAEADDDEQPQVELLAYALFFLRKPLEILVLTEDVAPHPFRDSIAASARNLSMGTLTIADFVALRGL